MRKKARAGENVVSALRVTRQQINRFTQIKLAIRPVRRQPALGAGDGDLCRHLATAFVRPVYRKMGRHPRVPVQGRVDFVIRLGREYLVEDSPRNSRRLAKEPVEDVDRMRSIVLLTATAFCPLGPPRRPIRSQHDRAVGFGQGMCDRAKRPGIDNPLHLAEGANVAGVIPDLSH